MDYECGPYQECKENEYYPGTGDCVCIEDYHMNAQGDCESKLRLFTRYIEDLT